MDDDDENEQHEEDVMHRCVTSPMDNHGAIACEVSTNITIKKQNTLWDEEKIAVVQLVIARKGVKAFTQVGRKNDFYVVPGGQMETNETQQSEDQGENLKRPKITAGEPGAVTRKKTSKSKSTPRKERPLEIHEEIKSKTPEEENGMNDSQQSCVLTEMDKEGTLEMQNK